MPSPAGLHVEHGDAVELVQHRSADARSGGLLQHWGGDEPGNGPENAVGRLLGIKDGAGQRRDDVAPHQTGPAGVGGDPGLAQQRAKTGRDGQVDGGAAAGLGGTADPGRSVLRPDVPGWPVELWPRVWTAVVGPGVAPWRDVAPTRPPPAAPPRREMATMTATTPSVARPATATPAIRRRLDGTGTSVETPWRG